MALISIGTLLLLAALLLHSYARAKAAAARRRTIADEIHRKKSRVMFGKPFKPPLKGGNGSNKRVKTRFESLAGFEHAFDSREEEEGEATSTSSSRCSLSGLLRRCVIFVGTVIAVGGVVAIIASAFMDEI